MPALSFESPVGLLTAVERDGAIVALSWGCPADPDETPLLREAKRQLDAYFAGRLRDFDLPIAPDGSAFQRRVGEAMRRIPYGEVRTYGDLAREVGSAARAIGGACGRNPLPVIVPCHRVLGSAGAIGGYSGGGGLDTKRQLLALERGGPLV
jgi:methylated-DNA-[protein]-cysteine S-methyltransferase